MKKVMYVVMLALLAVAVGCSTTSRVATYKPEPVFGLSQNTSHVVTYYKDARGEWRWTIQAANGNIVADSGEGYKNLTDAQVALNNIGIGLCAGTIVYKQK